MSKRLPLCRKRTKKPRNLKLYTAVIRTVPAHKQKFYVKKHKKTKKPKKTKKSKKHKKRKHPKKKRRITYSKQPILRRSRKPVQTHPFTGGWPPKKEHLLINLKEMAKLRRKKRRRRRKNIFSSMF